MDTLAVARKIVQDPTQVRDDLAIWMQKCRWAGLSGLQYPKDYGVSIDLCQDFLLEGHPNPFLLLGITVAIQNPHESRTFCLIFAIVKSSRVPEKTPAYPISTIFTPPIFQNQWVLRFATLDPIFVLALLKMKATTTIAKGMGFNLQFKPTHLPTLYANLVHTPPLNIQDLKVLGGGDTTNSIVRVTIETQAGPQHHVFKSYLRLFEHNIEAARFSHLHAVKFSAVPLLEGTLVLKWGKQYTLLMISQFVENEGDGGKPFWDHLQQYLHITQTQKYFKSILQKIGPLAQLVGQTTHEFHEALLKMKGNFDYTTEWEQDFRDNLANAAKLWTQRQPKLFPHVDLETISKISADLAHLMAEIKSRPLVNWSLDSTVQPIHGDLHLGQFLYQPGAPPRFIVTDLEGDPQLPPEKREESRTFWFDLGSLLRALDYIAFFGTLESLKQQVPTHLWSAEDVFAFFLLRLAAMPVPPVLEQYRWAGESTVAHALEWAEFVGTRILRGYGVKDRLQDELPVTFKLIRATSELNYELGFRGQNALVPLLGVFTMGNQWLQLKNTR